MIEQLVTVLRYRLPYRRELTIVGHADDIVTFTPADGLEDSHDKQKSSSTAKFTKASPNKSPKSVTKQRGVLQCNVSAEASDNARQRLTLVLSNDKVIELCELLQPHKGTYTIASDSGDPARVVFDITPTQILNATGDEVIDVVGDKTEETNTRKRKR